MKAAEWNQNIYDRSGNRLGRCKKTEILNICPTIASKTVKVYNLPKGEGEKNVSLAIQQWIRANETVTIK